MDAMSWISSPLAHIPFKNASSHLILHPSFYLRSEHYGLGKHLFLDASNDITLPSGAKILLVEDGFAFDLDCIQPVWAIKDYGIKVVVGTQLSPSLKDFAEQTGLLCIELPASAKSKLLRLSSEGEPLVQVDVAQAVISCREESFHFELDPFTRYCYGAGIPRPKNPQVYVRQTKQGSHLSC